MTNDRVNQTYVWKLLLFKLLSMLTFQKIFAFKPWNYKQMVKFQIQLKHEIDPIENMCK